MIKPLIILLLLASNAYAEPLKASWYSNASLIKEGTRHKGEVALMANGKVFDENKLTCSCRMFPLSTVLKITNTKNGKAVKVIVTDRIGKRFAKTRIDLSMGAFKKIADLKQGVITIKAEVVKCLY